MQKIALSIAEYTDKLTAILNSFGMPEADARIAATAIMDSEISGVESHGLTRVKPYTDRLAAGMIAPRPQIKEIINGAVAQVDGGNGMGQVVTDRAVTLALKLAAQYGIGAVTVCHSNHFGAAGYYSNKIAKAGCLGFVASLAGPTTAPFGGRDLMLGTNPFSVAFPGTTMTFCADMATSAVAKGKIRIYAKNGKAIPLGWALDANGNDTTDPQAAIKGILLPMAGHKGYALAMAVDAVCGLLSGALLSCESVSVGNADRPANTGHFILALDIAHFLPLEDFKMRAQNWFDHIKASSTRPGFNSIMIPGEPESQKRASANTTVSVLEETVKMIDELYAACRA